VPDSFHALTPPRPLPYDVHPPSHTLTLPTHNARFNNKLSTSQLVFAYVPKCAIQVDVLF